MAAVTYPVGPNRGRLFRAMGVLRNLHARPAMKLLDRVRHAARAKHFSYRTEQCYAAWAERFIRFHRIRHLDTMGCRRSRPS
jgi:Phage integrase, N-terminal SAM-like domain